jgi:hypothetical protein
MLLMRRHLGCRVIAVSVLGLVVALAPGVSARSQGQKSIFVSVVDGAGKPVLGLTAADFLMREDKSPREIVTVKPATQPLFVTMLGDTTKNAGNAGMAGRNASGSELIRDIRSAFVAFAHALAAASPDSQMSLMEFGQAPIPITRFTSSMPEIEKGITRLFPKQGAASVLLDALIDANKEIAKRNSPRRALVAINIEPGDEQGGREPNKIVQSFQASQASLWVASLQEGELRNPARGMVLDQLTRFTGGRREFILASSALENLLKDFAAALSNQYEVVYNRPASDKPPQVVEIGTTRQGVKVYANAFAPK